MSFGKEAEDRLMNGVRDVQSYIANGDSPDSAIIKVAQEHHLHPDMLPLVVQAVNVGRQAYQREKCSGQGVLAQLSDFPLASIENVKAALYPANPVTPVQQKLAHGVSKEYSLPPEPVRVHAQAQHVKLASAKLPASYTTPPESVYQGDPTSNVAHMQAEKIKIAREIDQAKVAKLAAEGKMLVALGQVANYFKYAGDHAVPLAVAEWHAIQQFGMPAKDVFDYITIRNHSGTKTARATAEPPVNWLISPLTQPLPLVKAALDKAAVYLAARNHHQQLEGAKTEKIAQLMRPFSVHLPEAPMRALGRPEPDYSPSAVKQAASWVGQVMGGLGMGTGMASVMRPPDRSSMVEDIGSSLDDPDHVNELRSIESRSMLNDFLANDDVISGFDPHEVSNAYNEIVQLSPSSSTQPALMRPLLRKRLTAGAVEPHEAQQIADIEKTVQQTQPHAQGGAKPYVSPVRD